MSRIFESIQAGRGQINKLQFAEGFHLKDEIPLQTGACFSRCCRRPFLSQILFGDGYIRLNVSAGLYIQKVKKFALSTFIGNCLLV